jgi:hypothetical protein
MRRLRVLPPRSHFFHAGLCSFPSSDGLVAPGMHAVVPLRFTPDSFGDVHDVLTVDTELSRFEVPLCAVRMAPRLSLPVCWDVGPVYLGAAVQRQVAVRGLAGAGVFQIVPVEAWPEEVGAVVAGGQEVCVGGCFVMSPARFELELGQEVWLMLRFAPTEAGTRAWPCFCCFPIASDACRYPAKVQVRVVLGVWTHACLLMWPQVTCRPSRRPLCPRLRQLPGPRALPRRHCPPHSPLHHRHRRSTPPESHINALEWDSPPPSPPSPAAIYSAR